MAARLRSPYSQVLPICFKASSHLPLYPKLLLALRIPSPQLPILLITQPLLLFSPLLSPCPLAISTAQFLNFSLFSCILALPYPSLPPLFSPTSLALARSSLLSFSLCSGQFQMTVDGFSLLFIIKSFPVMEWPFQLCLDCGPSHTNTGTVKMVGDIPALGFHRMIGSSSW